MSDASSPAAVLGFADALRGKLPAAEIQSGGLTRFAVDGVTPQLAVAPRTIDELAYVLSEAHRAGQTVIAFGGGSHIGLGNLPGSYDVALSLASMDRIIEHEAADLTVTLEAGATIAEVQAHLAAYGQFLPLDPPCHDASPTIGGVLATNAYGPLRHAFGTARDWLIGVRVVQADGTLTKSGGRVVKNVTGYDMGKLYIGSLGTLATIAEATFRVAPLPKTSATLAIACTSPHAACTNAFSAHDAGLALHAMELLSPVAAETLARSRRWTLLARVAGGQRAVDRTVAEMQASARAMSAHVQMLDGATAWDAWRRAFSPADLSMRVSVLPSRVPDVMRALEAAFDDPGLMASVTVSVGLVRLRFTSQADARELECVASVRDIAARFGGTAIVDAAPPAVKRAIDVFGETAGDFSIMRRLKEEFDPLRTLAPGRFVGRL